MIVKIYVVLNTIKSVWLKNEKSEIMNFKYLNKSNHIHKIRIHKRIEDATAEDNEE